MPRRGVCTHTSPPVPTPWGRYVLKTHLQRSVLVAETLLWRKTVPCHGRTQPSRSYCFFFFLPWWDESIRGEHQRKKKWGSVLQLQEIRHPFPPKSQVSFLGFSTCFSAAHGDLICSTSFRAWKHLRWALCVPPNLPLALPLPLESERPWASPTLFLQA